MKAMVLHEQGQLLQAEQVDKPICGEDQVLIRISACGVCRTDLHVCDGDLDNPKLPLIPGHEIVGYIEERGSKVRGLQLGQRVGVPWLGSTCGHCFYCRHGMENLCDEPGFTGYQIDGGYAEYTVANQHFVFPLDMSMDDVEVAPLLCAGLIGFRSYRMAGECSRLGVYGFGAAAHIITQIAIHQGVEVYAFTREGDTASQEFARALGVTWAGNSGDKPPKELDACIIYAPVGELVPLALKVLRKGGILVCAGIHMSDIPTFPYASLWGERVIRSVANLTRRDGEDYFRLLENISVDTTTTPYKLEDANSALADLREGRLQGAAVLVLGS
jgi:propanol-preferring alcohol dehydrogenase